MELTQDYVKYLFEYVDGILYWKNPTNTKIKIGTKAGTLTPIGYINIKINKKHYKAHRLIFMYIKGYVPKYLDHINGNKADNKIENLRPATISENNCNRKRSDTTTSGIKGVTWHSPTKKWKVRLGIKGFVKYLGIFDTLEEATKVIQEARMQYHGDFANNG